MRPWAFPHPRAVIGRRAPSKASGRSDSDDDDSSRHTRRGAQLHLGAQGVDLGGVVKHCKEIAEADNGPTSGPAPEGRAVLATPVSPLLYEGGERSKRCAPGAQGHDDGAAGPFSAAGAGSVAAQEASSCSASWLGEPGSTA